MIIIPLAEVNSANEYNLEQELPGIDQDEGKRKELLDLYRDMAARLERLAEQGDIFTFSFVEPRDMTRKVVRHLAEGEIPQSDGRSGKDNGRTSR